MEMILSKFPARIVKGLRFRLPKPLREKYSIRKGDFVVLSIEKDGARLTKTFKVSSDGLIYLPRDDALMLGVNDGELVDVSLLECIYAEPEQLVAESS